MLIRRARKLYRDESLGLDVEINARVYALDSSTIDLCLALFDWAPFRSTKAAIKLHTLLDLRGNIPSFILISDGKMADVRVLDILLIEAGAFYVMDRGYLDFSRLFALHQRGAFFVIGAKSNTNARSVYSNTVDKATGVMCDQRVALNGYQTGRDYPEMLRRVRFKDLETGKTLVFLTNNMILPAHVIAAPYKNRWQVELFFKWIKQHLQIKNFWAPVRTLCARKYGAPSPLMCSSPSSKRSFNSMPHSTLVYRFCRSLSLRKPRLHAPCSPMTTKLQRRTTLTS